MKEETRNTTTLFPAGTRVRIINSNVNTDAGGTGTVIHPVPDSKSGYNHYVRVDADGSELYCKVESLPDPPKKKNKNLIEIDYVELSEDKVKILAIRNLIGYEEIGRRYGSKVELDYTKAKYTMIPGTKGLNTLWVRGPYGDLDITKPLPIIWAKPRFIRLVEYMKKAGSILSQLIKKEREKKAEERKIKTIII